MSAATCDTAILLKFTENIFQDYRSLVSETKRKFPPIKENVESMISKLRSIINSNEDLRASLLSCSKPLVSPFLSGCATKNTKIVVLCLTAIQRFINHQCLSEDGAECLIDALWQVMECNMEDLRLLQTLILLLTTTPLVKGSLLAKAFTICLKLHQSKTPATLNTAAAAFRQCACATFDRVLKEDPSLLISNDEILSKVVSIVELHSLDVEQLKPSARDAFMLFQDICFALSDEPCCWLPNPVYLNKSLGLELIESLLSVYSIIFRQHPAFAYLLKTNLCPLIIKLFSPSLKLHSPPSGTSPGLTQVASTAFAVATAAITSVSGSSPGSATNPNTGPANEKSHFPLFVRLKRLIIVIVNQYFHLLNTECEIYLSLLIRFLSGNKAIWQRSLALEVLYKLIHHPELIRYICLSYDMRPHATKIFQELINAISHYIQAAITNHTVNDENIKEVNQQVGSVGSLAINQSMLYFKGSYFSVTLQFKIMLLDMLDRTEVPIVPDNHCLSLAIGCLGKVVESLNAIIKSPLTTISIPALNTNSSVSSTDSKTEVVDYQKFCQTLISLSWCGILSACNLLLETSADNEITITLVHSIQCMIELCGRLNIAEARDAFSIVLCKAALPNSCARSLFNSQLKNTLPSGVQTFQLPDDACERSNIVLTVTASGSGYMVTITPNAVPTSGQPNSTTTVVGSSQSGVNQPSSTDANSPGSYIYVTAKHILVANAVLVAAHAHGNVLDTSWNIFLTTLQNLTWLLGLKIEPSVELYAKHDKDINIQTGTEVLENETVSTVSNTPATTSMVTNSNSASSNTISAELSNISSMLTRLFVQSGQLNADALNAMVTSLCGLSSKTLETIESNKEPSRFPISKLTELGLVNIHRLSLWWKFVYEHLLNVCRSSHTALHRLGADYLVLLIEQIIASCQSPPFWSNETLAVEVLTPLTLLSDISYDDVLQKQRNCVQKLIYCWGDQINNSWLRLIEITGTIHDSYKIDLVQTSFKCFKLIVTDYLSTLLPNCYPACVETAAKFGHQKQDLNIALTAIESILHLADFLMAKDPNMLIQLDVDNTIEMKLLWIRVFHKLVDLCSDRRSAIRRSACQTLFTTIECHGTQFDKSTWSDLLWKILFPLLSNVCNLYLNAPTERSDRSNNLLVHHSRDTAAKQCAETVVLTLSGVAHCFVSKQEQLFNLDDYLKAWCTLLEHLKLTASMPCSEIAITSLRCMEILLDVQAKTIERSRYIWSQYWECWVHIGQKSIEFINSLPPLQSTFILHSNNSDIETDSTIAKSDCSVNGEICVNKIQAPFLPNTAFMTLLFDLFRAIFVKIKPNFNETEFDRFAQITQKGALVLLYIKIIYPQVNSVHYPVVDNGTMNPLQDSIIKCLHCLIKSVTSDEQGNLHSILPRLLKLLLSLASYAVFIPNPGKSKNYHHLDLVPLNYVMFAEKSLLMAVDLYETAVNWDNVGVDALHSIIETLRQSMSLKYACPSQTTWLLSCRCFFHVIAAGVNVISIKPTTVKSKSILSRQDSTNKENLTVIHQLCKDIADTMQEFLFYERQPPTTLTTEEFQQHEELDCKFVNLISDLFLSNSTELPNFFIGRLIELLSSGSVQTNPLSSADSQNGLLFNQKTSHQFNEINGDHTSQQQSQQLQQSTIAVPKLLGKAVRQSDLSDSIHESHIDPTMNWQLNLNQLRQYTFRENFARLCFDKLLCHAFSTNEDSSGRRLNLGSANIAATVSRTAVQTILKRCRLTLIQFYNASLLIGKCPLPRSYLSEISYVFKALIMILTSFKNVSTECNVDDTIWTSLIQLYPHVVDCVLLSGNGDAKLAITLHQLLRLYGALFAPNQLAKSAEETAGTVLMELDLPEHGGHHNNAKSIHASNIANKNVKLQNIDDLLNAL